MGDLAEYLDGLDASDRALVAAVYETARRVVPDAVEGRSYGMPALRYRDRPLIAVMATKEHLGVYPFSPAVVDAVARSLGDASWSKGTLRFRRDRPPTAEVVERIVALRRDEIDAATR